MTVRVYEAIAAVTSEMAAEGISKSRRNSQQGYNFRGIDDVYNTLSPALAKHKLCILPRILTRDIVERQTAKGGALFYVTVEAEFDFVAAEDGSKHTVRTYGEAMDSADKATNKAMSAAYKYAAMQAFCIPTEGDNDADATTHEVQPKQADPAPETIALISDAECGRIVALAKQAGKSVPDICKAYKIDVLPDLPARKAAKLVQRLEEEAAARLKQPDPGPDPTDPSQIIDDDIPF